MSYMCNVWDFYYIKYIYIFIDGCIYTSFTRFTGFSGDLLDLLKVMADLILSGDCPSLGGKQNQ